MVTGLNLTMEERSCSCCVITLLLTMLGYIVGMNAAVRAVVRMGIYVGCRVFLINEVSIMSSSFLSVSYLFTT